jgi:hypothetical protein
LNPQELSELLGPLGVSGSPDGINNFVSAVTPDVPKDIATRHRSNSNKKYNSNYKRSQKAKDSERTRSSRMAGGNFEPANKMP